MPNPARQRLFSYPLPEPQNTAYSRLGIAPEATAADIRAAKNRILERLQNKQEEVRQNLGQIYRQVPELSQLLKEVEALRSEGISGNDRQLNEKEKRLAQLEDQAISVNADYRDLLREAEDLRRQVNDINNMKLEDKEGRSKFDQETPPCALLKLEKYEQEIFTDTGRRLALFRLRLELVDFLEQKGQACYHPSDLTRKDFSSDFTPNPLLDE